jgi:methylmalonyl-CoA/ethylmalonyl-CoA epimerase
MIEHINHIGVAVKSLEENIPFYRDVLKLPFAGIEEVADQKVRLAVFKAGETRIELLEPTAEDSPIARFIEKRGEGMHHLGYTVQGIEKAIAGLKAQGVRMIDESPRHGSGGTRIAFLHPSSSGKVLTELTEEP